MRVNRSLLGAITVPLVALAAVSLLLLTIKGRIVPDKLYSGVPGAGKTYARPATHHGHCATMPAGGKFVGVAVNAPITQAVTFFRQATDVRPAVVEFYTAFGSPFPGREARQAESEGAVPLVQLNPRHVPLYEIAAGQYDRYLRHYARAIRAFKCSVLLSFGHEMNGSWYRWSRPYASPAQFIAAWRRIHDVFASSRVTNVTWSWDPSHGGSPARQWWPGARYVDWVGIDGYQRPGQTFSGVFGRQLRNIRSFTYKPIFIAETAVAPGPEQTHQITGLFDALSQYHLLGLVWFNVNRLEPWRLNDRSAAIDAFRRSAMNLGGRS